MDIIDLAAKALSRLVEEGISVKQGWYDKNIKDTHITLWALDDNETGYSDDDAELEEGFIQVNIWGIYDCVDLKKRVKKMMKSAGFMYEAGNDNYEDDTKIYVKQMRFYYISELEE